MSTKAISSKTIDTTEVRAARNQLMDDLGSFLADAQSLLDATGAVGTQATQLLRDRLQAAVDEAQVRLQDARVAAGRRVRQVDEQVRAHPWEASAVAVLAGLALGRLSQGPYLINSLARLAAFGVAGTAGYRLWEHHRAGRLPQPEVEEVGRWESEGGAAPVATPS